MGSSVDDNHALCMLTRMVYIPSAFVFVCLFVGVFCITNVARYIDTCTEIGMLQACRYGDHCYNSGVHN